MADDLIRLDLVANASGQVGALKEVSATATQLNVDLGKVGEAGAEAGEKVSEGMKKAEYSMMEARHGAMLLGEEIGVKLPRSLTMCIARSETFGKVFAAAFSTLAVVGFLEIATRIGEKLSEVVSSVFVFTDAMKAEDEAASTMNAELVKSEERLDAAQKAFDRVGLSAEALARLRVGDQLAAALKEAQEAANKARSAVEKQDPAWKTALKGATDYFLGTGIMIDDASRKVTALAQIDAELNKSVSNDKKADAISLAAVEKIAEEQKAKTAEANMATFNKLMLEQRNYAGDLVLHLNEMNAAIMKLPTEHLGKMSLDLNSAKDSMTLGADAAHAYGITLKTDLVAQLKDMETAFENLKKSGLANTQQLAAFAKQITDLKNQIKDFDSTAKTAFMSQAEATDALSGRMNSILNTQALMKKGWSEFGKEALLNLQEVEAALIKHLAIALLTDNMQKLSHAKVAAAGAYEAMAPIPFIGPELGALAAASVFASAMAFKMGGVVPAAQFGMMTPPNGSPDGSMALLHPNEMVLPAPLSQTVQDMAASATGSKGGGDIHVHAMDAASFQSFLKRNPGALARGIEHSADRGHLNVGKIARGK